MFANHFLWACWPLWFRRFFSFSFFAMTHHNTYSLCVGLFIFNHAACSNPLHSLAVVHFQLFSLETPPLAHAQ